MLASLLWMESTKSMFFIILCFQSANPLLTHVEIVECVETVHQKVQEEQERKWPFELLAVSHALHTVWY